VELIKGHIYQCDGEIYRAGKRGDVLFLFRVDEEKGETLPALSVGERLGFVQLPDNRWGQLVQGSPESDGSILDTPWCVANFEHLADSSEEYVRKRAMGYYRLLHGHVYQDEIGTFVAIKRQTEPGWFLCRLKPDQVARVERTRGAILGYLQRQDGAWELMVAGDPEQGDPPTLFVPCELDLLQLKDVGDDAFDYMTDKNFRDLMCGMTL
jgi:hypothetical protein